MTNVVITLLGNDRAGLVGAVSEVVSRHGGNWERSLLSELAGKFAGIVHVTVADAAVDALLRDLDAVEATGLLDITAERAPQPTSGVPPTGTVALGLIGQDHKGIVAEVSSVLAANGVSIEELETQVMPAPEEGSLFSAHAVLQVPEELTLDDLRDRLEAVTPDLMVELDRI